MNLQKVFIISTERDLKMGTTTGQYEAVVLEQDQRKVFKVSIDQNMLWKTLSVANYAGYFLYGLEVIQFIKNSRKIFNRI